MTGPIDSAAQADARRSERILGFIVAYLLPLGLVAGLLAVMIAFRYRAGSAVANVVDYLPFGWAFAAGVVSSVNPCGFFMLPAYLSYQLGVEDNTFYESPAMLRALKALALGLVATTGFVLLMAVVGGVLVAGGRLLVHAFPYLGAAIGVSLGTLGVWLLVTGRSFGIPGASRVAVTPRRTLANGFFFGVAYALTSLSCTLPVFLLVVGTALTSRGLAGSLAQFMSYGLGMGAVLIAVTIGAALFRDAVAASLRRLLPHVHRISAFFLIGAGIYLLYYWVWLSGSIL
ncbi:MAG: cytochrome c biogenesis CcdA family protein [bacterium]